MIKTSISMDNRSQAASLPAEYFSKEIKKLYVQAVKNGCILSPLNQSWDSFFMRDNKVSDDFIKDREVTLQPERDNF